MIKKEIIFKESLTKSIINDHRIANPVFMNKLILFPSLNGKIIIVSKDKKQIIRRLTVDSSIRFNNITHLSINDDTLIASTNNNIITLGDNDFHTKKIQILDIKIYNKYIYIVTLDGSLLKLDYDLKIVATKKFKYAKFYTIANSKDFLYLLEKNDLLIKLDYNLNIITIFDHYFGENDFVVSIKDKIYYQDEYILLK